MFDLDRWQEVLVTLSRNKRRSLLTAFGVFWGVFMLIIMLSAGFGLSNGVSSEVEGVPTNSAFIWSNITTKPYKGFRKGRQWDLRIDDVVAIKDNFPELEDVSPLVSGRSTNVVNGEHSGSYRIKGVHDTYVDYIPLIFPQGRFFNKLDIRNARKVCVIGSKVRDDLFPKGENPIGQYVKLFGSMFQIIGVTESRVSMNINGPDDQSVFLPYTVVQAIFNLGDKIHLLTIRGKANTPIEATVNDVKALLRTRHLIHPDDLQGVDGLNFEKMYQRFALMFIAINMLIWVVGIGTLLSGVIGVSNIIMITVRERTKEIGIRRALGAKPVSIISQIMSESLVLTAVAGFAGLCLGVFVMDIVNKIISANPSEDAFFKNPEILFSTAILASVIIIVSGLLSGILPAWRAMKIKAIDAIREE